MKGFGFCKFLMEERESVKIMAVSAWELLFWKSSSAKYIAESSAERMLMLLLSLQEKLAFSSVLQLSLKNPHPIISRFLSADPSV